MSLFHLLMWLIQRNYCYLCLVSGVFKTINSTVNGILSLGEVLDMAGRLEMFLTEEEGSRIYALMDTDGDEKVKQQ